MGMCALYKVFSSKWKKQQMRKTEGNTKGINYKLLTTIFLVKIKLNKYLLEKKGQAILDWLQQYVNMISW